MVIIILAMKITINNKLNQTLQRQAFYEWYRMYVNADFYKRTSYIVLCWLIIAICNCKQSYAVLIGIVAKDNYPYSYMQNNTLTGLSVDVAQLVSKEINWPIKIIQEKSALMLNRLLIKEDPVIDFIMLHKKQLDKLNENIKEKLDISKEVFNGYYLVIPSSIILMRIINSKIEKIKKSDEYKKLLDKYSVQK